MAIPQIRFKGFDDDWEATSLDKCCDNFSTGKLDANAMTVDGEYPFFTCAKEQCFIDKYAFDTEALLVSGNGNIGYVHYYNGKFNAYQRTYVLSEFNKNIQYVRQFLNANLSERVNAEAYTGCTPYIRLSTLTEMPFIFPVQESEQQAIATFLANIDTLIKSHKDKLEKILNIKKAFLIKMFPTEKAKTPEIRFSGFTGDWIKTKLGGLAIEIKRKATPNSNAPVMMISASSGFINQSEKYSGDNAGSSLENYTLLLKGELAYNHGYSKLRNFGSCFELKENEARVPYVYHTFSLPNEDATFFAHYLNSGIFDMELRKRVSSTARMDGLLNISYDSYMTLEVMRPEIKEQQAIGEFFGNLDKTISLYQTETTILENIKATLLCKMFAKV